MASKPWSCFWSSRVNSFLMSEPRTQKLKCGGVDSRKPLGFGGQDRCRARRAMEGTLSIGGGWGAGGAVEPRRRIGEHSGSVLTQLKPLPCSASPSRPSTAHALSGRQVSGGSCCLWQFPQIQAAGPTPTLLPLANRKPNQTPSRSPQPPSQQTKSYRKHLEDRAAGRETLCPEEERVFRITGVSQELGEGCSCLTVLLWVPTSC